MSGSRCSVHAMNIDDIDPGVRMVAAALDDAGFDVTDSCDGVARGRDVMDTPYVSVACTPADMADTADRLMAWARARGLPVGSQGDPDVRVWITASYDPADGTALTVLVGVYDRDIVPWPHGTVWLGTDEIVSYLEAGVDLSQRCLVVCDGDGRAAVASTVQRLGLSERVTVCTVGPRRGLHARRFDRLMVQEGVACHDRGFWTEVAVRMVR
jgi:hypothetical protein